MKVWSKYATISFFVKQKKILNAGVACVPNGHVQCVRVSTLLFSFNHYKKNSQKLQSILLL